MSEKMPAVVTPEQVKFYHDNGYLVIENFFTPQEIALLKNDINNLLNNHQASLIEGHVKLMGTKPMFDSVQDATFFYEKRSIDNGKLIDPLEKAVHKIAHGVQLHCDGAKKITFSDKMREVFKSTSGFTNPVVMQGMFILKQPKIGEESPTHRDESYLITKPLGKVLGAWIAIDDSTEENGCLQFVPGSHKNVDSYPLWVRDQEELEKQKSDPLKSAMKFVGEGNYEQFEGKFVKAPAKSGSLVLIHGLVVHKSNPNTSPNSRAAYTFHCFEKGNGVVWDERNWAQEKNGFQFPALY